MDDLASVDAAAGIDRVKVELGARAAGQNLGPERAGQRGRGFTEVSFFLHHSVIVPV